MKAIIFVVLALAAVALAKDQTAVQVTVTKADVTLTQKDIATWGVPPQIYTYSFRECFYCNYTCSIQNSFQQLNAQLKGCLSGCAGQDFCKEYVKPLWKRPATPYASLWRLVTLPSDLAVDLSLARRVEAGSSYIYKPVYIPYPWMCAQEPEWVEPEYKPEPVTILYVTAGYNIVSSSETPVHALRLWLPPSIIAEKALITSPQTSVVYGN